jgi:ribosome maturation protein SDO1
MTVVTARIKIKGKHYEISVDLDEALKIKNGAGDIISAVQSPNVYHDVKKGEVPSQKDLIDAFGTANFHEIAKHIIVKGEVQKTQEFRDTEKEKRIKQVIDIVVRNASDQNGRPYTEERIKRASEEIHFHFDNRPAEQQMHDLIHKLKEIIPIKIETKRIKLRIPARFTGQVYGVLKDYKESEEWLANGDLEVIVNVPAGIQIDFYDKLNSVTHGAVQSEEMTSK